MSSCRASPPSRPRRSRWATSSPPKSADGLARDLGDALILLHDGVLRRIAPDDQDAEITITEDDHEAIGELDSLNGEEATLAFASWVTESYPQMIEDWRQAGQQDELSDLSQAVIPLLEQQQAVAEEIVAAEGDLDAIDSSVGEQLQLGGAEVGTSEGDGPTGAEGQVGERQHTPDPEPPAVQSGENYAHEQVETDAHVETQTAPQSGSENLAAGDLDVVNAGGLFSALNNISAEVDQLESEDVAADQVRVVAVTDLLTETEMESFRTALSGVESDLSSLRDAASGSSAISDAVEQAGASADEVVAVDVLDEGVVVYTYSG